MSLKMKKKKKMRNVEKREKCIDVNLSSVVSHQSQLISFKQLTSKMSTSVPDFNFLVAFMFDKSRG